MKFSKVVEICLHFFEILTPSNLTRGGAVFVKGDKPLPSNRDNPTKGFGGWGVWAKTQGREGFGEGVRLFFDMSGL